MQADKIDLEQVEKLDSDLKVIRQMLNSRDVNLPYVCRVISKFLLQPIVLPSLVNPILKELYDLGSLSKNDILKVLNKVLDKKVLKDTYLAETKESRLFLLLSLLDSMQLINILNRLSKSKKYLKDTYNYLFREDFTNNTTNYTNDNKNSLEALKKPLNKVLPNNKYGIPNEVYAKMTKKERNALSLKKARETLQQKRLEEKRQKELQKQAKINKEFTKYNSDF